MFDGANPALVTGGGPEAVAALAFTLAVIAIAVGALILLGRFSGRRAR